MTSLRSILSILLLLAPLASAADAPRQLFPDDYQRQECAPKNNCTAVSPLKFGPIAKLRGYHLTHDWVVAHYDELMKLMAPLCEKVANCQTVPGNHWVWCKDVLTDDFPAACGHFSDEKDREQCRYFTTVFFLAQDDATHATHAAAQECGTAKRAGTPERTFEYWMTPARLPRDFNGKVTIYAIDSETHIPVMAHLAIDSNRFYPQDTVDGTPLTAYVQKLDVDMKRVPRPDGHSSLAAPIVTISAAGYRTEQFALPVEDSKMMLEMFPRVLRRGKNIVSITAHDSVTGDPIDARVMGDDRVLGKTNEPFEVVWQKGAPSPEIWVTSLYDLYDDAVLFPKTK